MQVEKAFLRSKVARRIFALFVVCALVPIAALTVISFYQVSKQLREASRRQLIQASKAQGMAILERLQMLDAELRLAAIQVREHEPAALGGGLHGHFLRVTVVGGPHATSLGTMIAGLSPEQEQHAFAGKTLARLQPCSSRKGICVVLVRVLDANRPEAGMLQAEVNADYLWATDDLPSSMEQCVFGSGMSPLSCSGADAATLGRAITGTGHSSGLLAWRDGRQQYDAGYWTLLLQPQFETNSWIVVLSRPHREELAALEHFRQTFPLVMLLALWVVLLASLVQIRRTLVPLEKLKESTQQIAAQNFSSRVDVHSGDEFEGLAESFNSMAHRLGRQFHVLKTIHDIDQAILGSLNRGEIVDAVLGHMPYLLPFDCFGITLLGPDSNLSWTRLMFKEARGEMQTRVLHTHPSPADLQHLGEHREALVVQKDEPVPDFLTPLRKLKLVSFLILPIFLDQRAFGALVCAHRGPLPATPEDMQQARQLADQLAVAFSNVQLIEALEQLHWGTLTALARAIDAKSAWTGGHSERVTHLSLKIGRAMGLPAKDLQIMHRGGLLHDIGKIGTPPSVLDKPGKLDAEETKTMRDHVRIGVRILEPIPGFQEALPIVAQHHEWFNGSGYPEGLAGEQISLHARIFAVADCYDAMTSDRPYRKGLPKGRVLQILKESSGTQFDPHVIDVFLQLCASEEPVQDADHTLQKMAEPAT